MVQVTIFPGENQVNAWFYIDSTTLSTQATPGMKALFALISTQKWGLISWNTADWQ
jgi:hypothetical protein